MHAYKIYKNDLIMKNIPISITFLVLTLLGAGCAVTTPERSTIKTSATPETRVSPFDVNSLTPPGATDVQVLDADFKGDGQKEKIFIYTSTDTTSRNESAKRQHLFVYEMAGGKWNVVAQDVLQNERTAVNRQLAKALVIDFGNTGKQELYLEYAIYRGGPEWSVLAYDLGSYIFVDPKPASDASLSDDYLKLAAGEAEALLTELSPSSAGVKETYAVFCTKDMAGKPESSVHEKSCRTTEYLVKYSEGNLQRSKVQ